MIDLDKLLYQHSARVWGAAVVVTLEGGGVVNLTVIDRTEGVEQSRGGVEIGTVEPAAEVRTSALLGLGLARGDLVKARFALSGRSWRVVSTQGVQSPAGEVAAMLFLSEAI